MPGLAGTPKNKKVQFMSSKLELKGLVKPETVSSTRSTLHLSRLNISFQFIEELTRSTLHLSRLNISFQCIEAFTRSTLHLSRLNISFQCIEELFQYIKR